MSKSLGSKLRAYAEATQASNLKVGFGVIGWFPFLTTIVGLGIIFITAIVMATQSGTAKDNGQSFFWVSIVGISMAAIGIVLSLINLAEIIEFIKFAASEDVTSPFVFRTPLEEANYQAKLKETSTAVARQQIPDFKERFRQQREDRIVDRFAESSGLTGNARIAFENGKAVYRVTVNGKRISLDVPDIRCGPNDGKTSALIKFFTEINKQNKVALSGAAVTPGDTMKTFLAQYPNDNCDSIVAKLKEDPDFVEKALNVFASQGVVSLEGGKFVKKIW